MQSPCPEFSGHCVVQCNTLEFPHCFSCRHVAYHAKHYILFSMQKILTACSRRSMGDPHWHAGLSLAASGACRSVRFVEISPECEAPFRAAARHIPSHVVLTFTVAAAGSDTNSFLAGADVVCVDPPRKGLEPALLQALCESPVAAEVAGHIHRDSESPQSEAAASGCLAHTLIYLSCGYKALERDCAALLASGQWRLHHCEAFAFFPATDALETLAVFERNRC